MRLLPIGRYLHTGRRRFDTEPIAKQWSLVPLYKVSSHFYGSFSYFKKYKLQNVTFYKYSCCAKFLMCSAAYLFMSWRQNMWFIVRLVGVAAREAVMFFLCCLSCAAAVLSSLLYVHPDMHPQAVCLSLFLLKLSSEVSEGLALLIPDTVNEKQASYTGRLTARKALLSPPLVSQWETV